MGGNEKVEIAASQVRETDKAYLINDGENDIWVPKSQVTWLDEKTIEMPEWLAKDKGLI